MHNPAAVLENDTHKLQRDFDIQTDHLKKKKKRKREIYCEIVDFAIPTDHRVKI